MFELEPSVLWMAAAGGVGGLLNAAASHNLFLWPDRLLAEPPIRIVRPGLAANVLIGAAAAAGVFEAYTYGVSRVWPLGSLLLALVAALVVGALAARWMTNETDKRLLRAALIKACAAPAAHPDICHIVASAPTHTVLEIADDLTPRFRGLR
jgi:hypothetical protein